MTFRPVCCVFSALFSLATLPAQQFASAPWMAFTPPPTPVLSVAAGDLDGDGYADLVFGRDGQPTMVYLSERGAGFAESTAGHLNSAPLASQTVKLADVDGDGDLDLVISNPYLAMQLYLNQGAGVFTDVTATHMPALTAYGTFTVDFVDVDGDGDLDLVFSTATFGAAAPHLWLNNGAGAFTDVTASRLLLPPTLTYAYVVGHTDLDQDGDEDLLLTDGAGRFLCLQNNTGVFTSVPRPGLTDLVLAWTSIYVCHFADFNGDGLADLLIGSGNGPVLLHGQPGGSFLNVSATHLPLNPYWFWGPFEVLDFDSDGDPDVVGTICYLRNDGTGRLWNEPHPGSATSLMTIGDFDADGDVDVYQHVGTCLVNLQRQLIPWTVPTLGQSFRLTVQSSPGRSLTPLLVGIPFLSLQPANVAFAGGGRVGIDLSAAVTLYPCLFSRVGGIQVWVPNQQALVGLQFFLQAAIADSAGGLGITNTLTEQIQ